MFQSPVDNSTRSHRKRLILVFKYIIQEAGCLDIRPGRATIRLEHEKEVSCLYTSLAGLIKLTYLGTLLGWSLFLTCRCSNRVRSRWSGSSTGCLASSSSHPRVVLLFAVAKSSKQIGRCESGGFVGGSMLLLLCNLALCHLTFLLGGLSTIITSRCSENISFSSRVCFVFLCSGCLVSLASFGLPRIFRFDIL